MKHTLTISRLNSKQFIVFLNAGKRKRNIYTDPETDVNYKQRMKENEQSLRVCFGFIPAKGKTYQVNVEVKETK